MPGSVKARLGCSTVCPMQLSAHRITRKNRVTFQILFDPYKIIRDLEEVLMTGLTRAALILPILLAPLAEAQSPRIFNTVKQKLAAGKQVVGGTVSIPDPDTYCAMANSGFDFLWIEMQHSPMSYQNVAHMIMACKGAPAMPFIRVPDATEGDIQKAVDMGAAGIIIPMVEDIQKVR